MARKKGGGGRKVRAKKKRVRGGVFIIPCLTVHLNFSLCNSNLTRSHEIFFIVCNLPQLPVLIPTTRPRGSNHYHTNPPLSHLHRQESNSINLAGSSQRGLHLFSLVALQMVPLITDMERKSQRKSQRESQRKSQKCSLTLRSRYTTVLFPSLLIHFDFATHHPTPLFHT